MVLVVGYHSIPRVTNWCRMACPSHLLRADAPGSVAFLSVPIYAMTLLRRMFCRWHLEVLDLSGFGVGFKHPCHMLCEYIYIQYIYIGCGAKPQLGWSGSTNSFFSGLKPPSNLVTCFYWTWFGDSGFTLCICTVALLYPLCFTPSIPCLRYKTCKLWPACTKSYESLRMRLQFLGLWLEGWCYIICLCYILYKIYCNVILYNVFDMFDKLYTIHLRASIPSFFFWGASHDTTEITLTGGDFPMHFYSLQRNDGQLHGALQSLLAKCDSKPAAGQRGRFRLWQKHGED